MPKNTEKVPHAHNGKKIATMHGFSAAEQARLEQALRASAKIIAPTPKGTIRHNPRSALYAAHKNQIMTQFQNQWDWSKASQKWTESSIGKVLANYLFDYNKKQEAPKTTKKADAPEPRVGQPKHIVPYLKEEDGPKRSRGRPRKLKSPFSLTPINRQSLSPRNRLLPRLTESPFDKPSNYPVDSVLPSTEHTPFEPGSEDASQSLPKLADIILVVYPSSSDPWGREIFSFPLWRCQAPVNGRDAAPESLRDWRDLSFDDFVRQLKAEKVLTAEEMIVWGEFEHMVTSDVTFASAVQEQLYDSPSNRTAPNEATFAIVGSKLLALILGKS